MTKLKQILIGIGQDPVLVATVRMLVLYALPLGAEWAIGWLAGVSDPRWAAAIPLTVAVIRALEGAVDRALKGAGANQTPPAGGIPPA